MSSIVANLLTDFLRDSKESTFNYEMIDVFYSEYKRDKKWELNPYNIDNVISLINMEDFDIDVLEFLRDSVIGSTWSDLLNDIYYEYLYYKLPDDIPSDMKNAASKGCIFLILYLIDTYIYIKT